MSVRNFLPSLLATAMLATPGLLAAQSIGFVVDPQAQPVEAAASAQYDWARVVQVQRVAVTDSRSGYGSQGQRCYTRDEGPVDGYRDHYEPYRNDPYRDGYRSGGSETGRQVATVVGGVLGAVLGSKVGGGSGRYATSALGSMVGGMAGREIYDQATRPTPRGQVTVCDPVPVDGRGNPGYGQAAHGEAYDVTYEYNGRRYTSRMDRHPGERVRVRVDVRPE